MIRRPPRSTQGVSSAASDVYKRQRQTVIELAKSKNIKVHERKIKPDELPNFEGCFLTGTAAEITPISQIAENNYKVCDLILDLSASYGKLVRKKKAA